MAWRATARSSSCGFVLPYSDMCLLFLGFLAGAVPPLGGLRPGHCSTVSCSFLLPAFGFRMDHTLIRNIHTDSQQWTIRVRVVRLSQFRSNDIRSSVLRLDFVLLDEEGTAVEGHIPEKWLNQFMPKMKENSLYYITSFELCAAFGNYRPVHTPYAMWFTHYTELHEICNVPPTFLNYACNIESFQALHQKMGTNEFCSDTVGIFVGCSHTRIQDTKGGPKNLRNVYLTDGRETTSLALWGHHAEMFNADRYMQIASQRTLPLLVVGVTCRRFGSKLQLTGSSNCAWYEDPELPEIAALLDRCGSQKFTPTYYGTALLQVIAQNITVAELSAFKNPHPIFHNRYIVDVKIKHVVANLPWCYMACMICNCTAVPNNDKYKCTDPKCISTSAQPRYRLGLLGVDPTASNSDDAAPTIELVFFGPRAEGIIGVPINALYTSNVDSNTSLPPRIKDLYGKYFRLRVGISKASLKQTNISYQVDSVEIMPTPPQQQTTKGKEHSPGDPKVNENQEKQDNVSTTTLPSPTLATELRTDKTAENSSRAESVEPLQQHTPPPAENIPQHGRGTKRTNEDRDKDSIGTDARPLYRSLRELLRKLQVLRPNKTTTQDLFSY